jgi:hypothetical protein
VPPRLRVFGKVALRGGAWLGCCECGFCASADSPDCAYAALAEHMLRVHGALELAIAVEV